MLLAILVIRVSAILLSIARPVMIVLLVGVIRAFVMFVSLMRIVLLAILASRSRVSANLLHTAGLTGIVLPATPATWVRAPASLPRRAEGIFWTRFWARFWTR